MNLGFLRGFRRKARPSWLDDLTPEERRHLARNLREILEPKRLIERSRSRSARRK